MRGFFYFYIYKTIRIHYEKTTTPHFIHHKY